MTFNKKEKKILQMRKHNEDRKHISSDYVRDKIPKYHSLWDHYYEKYTEKHL